MKDDITELEQIIDELREKVVVGSNPDLLHHAIQIQRNRILKAALFEVHPASPRGVVYLSNLQKIAENS